MVPPKNGFLSLRLPIFGSSYYQCFYTFGIAPLVNESCHHLVLANEYPLEDDGQQQQMQLMMDEQQLYKQQQGRQMQEHT